MMESPTTIQELEENKEEEDETNVYFRDSDLIKYINNVSNKPPTIYFLLESIVKLWQR